MTSQAKIYNSTTQVGVLIIGAGFGGLCMGIKLKEQGNDNFLILEKGHDVGGTWRDNNYPGCACDVQSHMYSYSFETKPDWTRRYAPWNEIQQYILDTTEKYNIRPYCRFGQEVDSAVFDEKRGTWSVTTKKGDRFICQHVVLASGPLHVPNTPNIKGLDKFEGKIFHSAQWEHDYDLSNKNVVSIGTGGSAIQYCPEIAPKVKQLYVMQRSPAWVIPRDERRYSGIEKSLFDKIPLLRTAHRYRLYWTNESRVWPIFNPPLAKAAQKLAQAFIKLQVKDKAVAQKLTPDYVLGCKRILISNKYYPMFNRQNVELVTDGIKEVKANSVVTSDGVERPADCIILGTGFVVDPRIYMKDFEVRGIGGRRLQDDWKDNVECYLGTSAPGYPNLWQLVGPNAGLGHNSIIFMIESQVHYILEALKTLDRKKKNFMDVKPEVSREFNDKLQEKIKTTVWGTGCQSWYTDAQGRNFTLWPKSTWRFWLETRRLNPGDYNFYATQPNSVANSEISSISADK